MTATRRRRGTTVLAAATAAVVLLTIPGANAAPATPGAAVEAADVTFITQVGGTYDGMPVFNANPDHLDAYLDQLMAYNDLEGVVRWASGIRGDYTIGSGETEGRVVPGAPNWDERLYGVSTRLPAPIGIAQSWNDNLVGEVGEVIGDEKLYQRDLSGSISDANVMVNVALMDTRINPLTGRFEEGFGEDPELTSRFVDAMAREVAGVDEEGNESGFWTKALVNTKHYTGYLAQWFREWGNGDIGARALMEYYAKTPIAGIESGGVGGMLTSFGRTNGVPNGISPLINYAQDFSPWGESGNLYTVPDNPADRQVDDDNSWSNGFDIRYSPSLADATALFSVAGQGSVAVNDGPTSPLISALVRHIETGTYGVTREDVEAIARANITPLIRAGLFNERDAEGNPMNYPFADLSDTRETPGNYTLPEHQDVALRSAQEGVVLLKNDNDLLPISADSNLAVVGPHSDVNFATIYAQVASARIPTIAGSGYTPVQGVEAVFGDTVNATDGQEIAIKSVATGQYMGHENSTNALLDASKKTAAEATSFEFFGWGQGGGFSLQSTLNDNWVEFKDDVPSVGMSAVDPWYAPAPKFGTPTSSTPYTLRLQENEDGTSSILVETFKFTFPGDFPLSYYQTGRYLKVDPATGAVGVSDVLTDAETAKKLNTEDTKFVFEQTRAAGTTAIEAASDDSYAIVVVGAPARHSASEGLDRSTLRMDDAQYELIETVGEAYPGRTIVVASANYPLALQEVQDNPNVGAVLYSADGGQYGNLAVAQILAGQATPSGRLTSTWYAGDDALPQLDAYSIPEGRNALYGLEDLDPRFTVDMTNGDPYETGLTYMYTDADVTYPFGYGLGYTDFTYDNMSIENVDAPTANVAVTNSGDSDGATVVQVYGSNSDSTYGDAAPRRVLVGFEKVTVPAGSTVIVPVAINLEALELWDVSRDEFVLEQGDYTIEAGGSSANLPIASTLKVQGQSVGAIDATTTPVNVFDASYKASDVTYREASKGHTVSSLAAEELVNGYYAVMARSQGGWTALNDVDFDGATGVTLSLASQEEEATVEIRLDAPDGQKVADVTVGTTGSTSYVISGKTAEADIPVNEAAYQDITAPLATTVSGTHDLYVVFPDEGVRITNLQLEVAAFSDVATDNQFYKEITWLADQGISEGWDNGDGTFAFRPLEPIARDAMAAFLYRLAGLPDVELPATSPFTDVSVDNQFYEEIVWLSQEGISTGWDNGDGTFSFRPLEPIARDAMAAFLYRSADSPAFTPPTTSPFEDVNPNVQFYKEITWMRQTGIATGWQGNDGRARYAPLESVARDAMAAFLYRFNQAEF